MQNDAKSFTTHLFNMAFHCEASFDGILTSHRSNVAILAAQSNYKRKKESIDAEWNYRFGIM